MQPNLKKKLINVSLSVMAAGGLFLAGETVLPAFHSANAAQVYDISQWQGWLSNAKVRRLKREVTFVILRAQNGGLYQDTQFRHNAYLMRKNHLPYGVYSYNLARTPQQARGEAYALVKRAPHAKFYVNDDESTNGNPHVAKSAVAWAKEVRHITNRPTVLYSYSAFMNSNLAPAVKEYSTVWLAQYSNYEPSESYHYDLWQFTDNHFSRALGQRLDDSTFPNNARPLSFWIGGHNGKMKAVKAPKNAFRHLKKHHRVNRRKHRTRRRGRKGDHSVNKFYNNADLNQYINSGYYSSPNVNRFRVIAKRGIDLYSVTTGKKIHHLRHGQKITRGSYQLFYHKNTGLTTEGVGVWHGHEVAYTMNRSQVKAY